MMTLFKVVSLKPDYVTDQLVPIEHIGTDYAVIQGVDIVLSNRR